MAQSTAGDADAHGGGSNKISRPVAGSQSPKPVATFFGIDTKHKKIMFVVDCSSSMGEFGVFDRVRQELLSSLRNLPKSCRFQIIVFNSKARLLCASKRGWLDASIAIKQDIAIKLNQLNASGRTAHQDALPFSLSYLPDVVFFLTDADDLTESYVRRVTDINQGRTVIHVIELNAENRSQPNMPLQILARQNRGCYRGIEPWANGQNAMPKPVTLRSFGSSLQLDSPSQDFAR